MKRASGEPAARATERLIGDVVLRDVDTVTLGGLTWPAATGGAIDRIVFSDEPPTSPINTGVLMTMPQAREALQSIPPDLQPLVWAIARGFWDDGFGVGAARLPRKPPDRSPEGMNTLAPLGKRRGKR